MNNKIDKELLSTIRTLSNSLQPCIIRFCTAAKADRYIKENHLDKDCYFHFIRSIVLKLNTSQIYSMAANCDVAYISSISKVCTQVNIAKTIIGGASSNTDMANFATAIIDTGLYPHLDMMLGNHANIIQFIDLVNGRNQIYDDNGHGTIVTSVLAGNGMVSDKKYRGVDNNNNLIIIKALDNNGETSAINILKAMQWIYDNSAQYNIRCVCMSFGSTVLEHNDPLILGAEALWNSGIVVVCACGNSGPEAYTIKSPSASTKVISVGALDDARANGKYNVDKFAVAEFSSRGPILGNYKPDIIVSGVEVVGASNYALTKQFYSTMSGTSVATPIVAGYVTRLIKKYPKYSPDQIKKVLISNCHSITGDRNSEGFGWLDLHKLLN